MMATGAPDAFQTIGAASLGIAIGSVAIVGLLLIRRHDVAIGVADALHGRRRRAPRPEARSQSGRVRAKLPDNPHRFTTRLGFGVLLWFTTLRDLLSVRARGR